MAQLNMMIGTDAEHISNSIWAIMWVAKRLYVMNFSVAFVFTKLNCHVAELTSVTIKLFDCLD
jgi:hypothetical protein